MYQWAEVPGREEGVVVSLTAAVKEELTKVAVPRRTPLIAELATLLRFVGTLHQHGARLALEAEVDTEAIARRVVAGIDHLYHFPMELNILGSGANSPHRYLLRLDPHGGDLARLLGLLDRRGVAVRGLPAAVVAGSVEDAAAAWRGAFLAHGSLTEPGRSCSLEVTCPCPEAALAMVGAARRLGINAKSREVRGTDRVVIRDAEQIGEMLRVIGAPETRAVWEDQRKRREVRATANRLANFDDANLRRSARAAVASAARVERAIEIMGDDIPDHLLAAGMLRLDHRQASLEELGRLAEPPMTKDAIAGRIRRLLSLADRRAEELGVPDTETAAAARNPELLDM